MQVERAFEKPASRLLKTKERNNSLLCPMDLAVAGQFTLHKPTCNLLVRREVVGDRSPTCPGTEAGPTAECRILVTDIMP